MSFPLRGAVGERRGEGAAAEARPAVAGAWLSAARGSGTMRGEGKEGRGTAMLLRPGGLGSSGGPAAAGERKMGGEAVAVELTAALGGERKNEGRGRSYCQVLGCTGQWEKGRRGGVGLLH